MTWAWFCCFYHFFMWILLVPPWLPCFCLGSSLGSHIAYCWNISLVSSDLWPLFFFNVDHFKSIEFDTVLLLFYVLVFWPRGMWEHSSPARDRTCTPCIERWSLSHWTTREVPTIIFLKRVKLLMFSHRSCLFPSLWTVCILFTCPIVPWKFYWFTEHFVLAFYTWYKLQTFFPLFCWPGFCCGFGF